MLPLNRNSKNRHESVEKQGEATECNVIWIGKLKRRARENKTITEIKTTLNAAQKIIDCTENTGRELKS